MGTTEKINLDEAISGAAEAAWAEHATEEEESPKEPESAPVESAEEKQVSPEAAEPSSKPAEASTAQQPEAEQLDPPHFWKKEDKAWFKTLTRQAQEGILRYEQQKNKYIQELEKGTKKSSEWSEKLSKVYTPERIRKFELQGEKIDDVLNKQLAWQEYFSEDKISAAVDFLKSFGYSPDDVGMILANLDGQPVPQNGGGYSRDDVERLVEERLTKFQSESQAQEEQARINAFAQEFLDSKGPIAAKLEPQIAHKIAELRSQYPFANPAELLEAAWEHVAKDFGIPGEQSQNGTQAAVQKSLAARQATSPIISGEAASSGNGASARPKFKGTLDQKIEQAIAHAERITAR